MLTNPTLQGDYTHVNEYPAIPDDETVIERYVQWTPHGWELDSYRVMPGTLGMHPVSLGPSVRPLVGDTLTIETAQKASRTLLRQPVRAEAGFYTLSARFTPNLLPLDLNKSSWWEELRWRVVLWEESGKIHELPWRTSTVWGAPLLFGEPFHVSSSQELTVGVEWYAVDGETLPRGEAPGIALHTIDLQPVKRPTLPYYSLEHGVFMSASGTGGQPVKDVPATQPAPLSTRPDAPRTLIIRLEVGNNLAALLNRLVDRLWPTT